jgi:hypothetical protein
MIFVVHSLGGLVVKKVEILLSSGFEVYQADSRLFRPILLGKQTTSFPVSCLKPMESSFSERRIEDPIWPAFSTTSFGHHQILQQRCL